ncbi:MAG: toprim domain-containing protein [Bacteroidota bacterium]
MNSIQAKQIHLPNLMKRLGYEPTAIKKGGGEYWFLSPFRTETEPSFHTSYLNGKWIWNDFGDIGGTVIDFVMRHEQLSGVKEALNFLDNLYPQWTSKSERKARIPSKSKDYSVPKGSQLLFSFQQQSRSYSPDLEFIRSVPVSNPLIYSYLQRKRAIPKRLVDRYLQQIHYKHTPSGKSFFAFGTKNQSEGYEVRMASDDYQFAKSCLGKKDVTLVKGKVPGSGQLNMFEGMLDFLSVLAMYDVDQLKGDSIILNSTQLIDRASSWIKNQSYEGINSFLDNDRAGEKCQAFLEAVFEETFIHPQNHLYAGFLDVNERLIDQKLLEKGIVYF